MHDSRAELARLAAEQHGVVSRAQLEALGVGRGAVAHWVRTGRLHRIQRGVFAVGHPRVTGHGRWMAAVLSCGPGAALSHASAAALWGIRPSASQYIDVSILTANGRAKRPGLRIHRTAQPLETTIHESVAITTVARTLLDITPSLTRSRMRHVLNQADQLRLLDVAEIRTTVAAHPTHPGAAELATLADTPTALTRSELEAALAEIAATLGAGTVNGTAAGLEVDLLFPGHLLAVEADSWAYHRTRAAFERDRERGALLAAAGYRVIRFSDTQLTQRPGEVAAAIEASLIRTPG